MSIEPVDRKVLVGLEIEKSYSTMDDCFYNVVADDVLSRIELAREMIATIARMVKES